MDDKANQVRPAALPCGKRPLLRPAVEMFVCVWVDGLDRRQGVGDCLPGVWAPLSLSLSTLTNTPT